MRKINFICRAKLRKKAIIVENELMSHSFMNLYYDKIYKI